MAAAAVLGRRARRLPVGSRRDRHEEHGRDVHRDHAAARARPARSSSATSSSRRSPTRRPAAISARDFSSSSTATLVEAEYAIGESGGFSLHLGDTTFYPVQVAEKGFCWVRARITGEPGHGSMPRARQRGHPARRGARAARRRRGCRCTRRSTSRTSSTRCARGSPRCSSRSSSCVARPQLLARVARLVPDASIARSFSALLANTAAATVVRAGEQDERDPGRRRVRDRRPHAARADRRGPPARAARGARPRRRARDHQVGAADGDRAGRRRRVFDIITRAGRTRASPTRSSCRT